MLHEALFALSGYSGCIFNFQKDEVEEYLLHPSEKNLLNRILIIGKKYHLLKSFMNKIRFQLGFEENVEEQEESQFIHGIYLQAFCDGLEEILQPYQNNICQLEEKILNNPETPLSFIVLTAEKYYGKFSVLISMIQEIKKNRISGCSLLSFVFLHLTSCGVEFRDDMKLLLKHCYQVFFQQLANWLIFGTLNDTHKEFFIRHLEENDDQLTATTFNPDTSNPQNINMESLHGFYPGFSDYKIDFDLVPCIIRISFAYKILFIGQTIQMLQKTPSLKSTGTTNLSFWYEKEPEFWKKFQELKSQDDIQPYDLEKIIDEIRQLVTEHLWHLAVKEASLFIHLKYMKDFLLLGRGELFNEFIRTTTSVLNKAPNNNIKRELNQAFQISAQKVFLNDEMALDKFSLFVPGKDSVPAKEDEHQPNNCWDVLSFKYDVSHPLHLLFTPIVLENYNHLFRFLLRVKKTQMNLTQTWIEQTKFKESRLNMVAWQLRNNLLFFINNLQYYLQVDVLESQFATMMTTINNCRDFEVVQRAHTLFQANILSQSFLLLEPLSDTLKGPHLPVAAGNYSTFKNNVVYTSITNIIELCDKFCIIALKKLPMTDIYIRLGDDFDILMQELFRLLQHLHNHPCGLHLNKLICRLDFNRWYSSKYMNASITDGTT